MCVSYCKGKKSYCQCGIMYARFSIAHFNKTNKESRIYTLSLTAAPAAAASEASPAAAEILRLGLWLFTRRIKRPGNSPLKTRTVIIFDHRREAMVNISHFPMIPTIILYLFICIIKIYIIVYKHEGGIRLNSWLTKPVIKKFPLLVGDVPGCD